MNRSTSVAGVLLLALTGAGAAAQEIYVEGRVLDVEPVYGSRTVMVQPTDCGTAPRPVPAAGLMALLRWDLQSDCSAVRRSEQTVTGYRVSYQWEDRVYSRIMREPPGETVTLRLKVR